MDWSEWVQGVSSGLINKWGDAKYVKPYEVQQMQLAALGEGGYYREGQPGTTGAVTQGAATSTTTVLLVGAAVLVMLMMKD